MPDDIGHSVTVLQEQGVSNSDPIKFYKEAQLDKEEEVDISTLMRKEKKRT